MLVSPGLNITQKFVLVLRFHEMALISFLVGHIKPQMEGKLFRESRP